MSATARWTIAIIGLLCAASFAAVALLSPPDSLTERNRWGIWGMVVFCALFPFVCFPGPLRSTASRLIGAAIFLTCVAYIVSEVGQPLPALGTYRRSDPNLINAALAFVVFGIPAGYVAVTGRLPGWTPQGQSSNTKGEALDEDKGNAE